MAGMRCQTLDISKTEFWRTHNSTLSIPWSALISCLKRVRPEGVTDFWLSSRKPHKPVCLCLLRLFCKSLKKVIVDSGALSGSARDVRSVGSSAAGLDIGKIMQSADWRRVRTFQSHYLKPLFVSEA